MFVKHIIKTLHVSDTIVWPSSGGRLSCLVLLLPSLLVCVVKLFIWYVAVCCQQYNVCIRMIPWFFFPRYEEKWSIWRKGYGLTYLCVCLMYLSVGFAHTSHRQVHQARTHIDNIQPHTKWTTWRRKQAEKVVTALSTKDDLMKMVKQLWPKHVGF